MWVSECLRERDSVCMHVCVHACVCICPCVCMCVCVGGWVCGGGWVRGCVCMHACLRMSVLALVSMPTCMLTLTHILEVNPRAIVHYLTEDEVSQLLVHILQLDIGYVSAMARVIVFQRLKAHIHARAHTHIHMYACPHTHAHTHTHTHAHQHQMVTLKEKKASVPEQRLH